MNDISEEKETPKLFDFQLKSSKFGIDVRIPCIKLSDNHPCKGCVWYDRNTDVLFCPFHKCVRYRKVNEMLIKRGDIFYADLNPVVGSEQGGIRPVLVVQNNVGNRHSPTIVVLPLSTAKKHYLPTHIHIRGSKTLPKDSIVLAEQIRTIDRYRLKSYVGSVDFELMEK